MSQSGKRERGKKGRKTDKCYIKSKCDRHLHELSARDAANEMKEKDEGGGKNKKSLSATGAPVHVIRILALASVHCKST